MNQEFCEVLNRVAIIGRPNVGKSTLFNVLTRTRKAVVKNEPGVTRDIQMQKTNWWGKDFEVVDTGGITEAADNFSKLIREQVLEVLSSIDMLIIVMDGRAGLVPEDRDIIKMAKQSGKPSLLVVNKVDQPHQADILVADFYEFGLDVVATSFERREGVDVLVEWIHSNLNEDKQEEAQKGIRLAIVGKPNVGKSSMCNYLLGEHRMIVSPIAGTTVDAIESSFVYNETKYTLVDTAGLRRASKREDGVEFLSSFKSYDAIDKADLVLLMVDGQQGPTVQDAKMIEYILDKHKAVILVANKVDIAKEDRPAFRSWFRDRVEDKLHFFTDIPVEFTSAVTGAGIKDLFERIEDVWQKLNIKIKTSRLNDFFFDSIRSAPAPVFGTRNVKFYYLTQTHQSPPSFIAFANHPEGVTPSYRRFLAKKIQAHFDLKGIPVRIFCMKSGDGKSKASKKVSYGTEDIVEDLEF